MKIGDLQWSQISGWDFFPNGCIVKFERLDNCTCKFVLKEITHIFSESHYKVGVVTDISQASECFFKAEENVSYGTYINNKFTKIG